MAVAHGGQVLVSLATEELVRDSLPSGIALQELGEHRLRDLSRPERVFQLRAAPLASEFPPLRSLDTLPGNLPVQFTSFVGRAQELARVVMELGAARLVSLTGVGGVGKTRLALEVAAEVVPDYRDGAWLVELAGVRDAEAVPDAVVMTFGLQPAGGRSPTETLLEFLRGKQLLLVLDNCEHLLRAVADLVGAILRGCPQVQVLVTSREGLNVAGEHMLGVPSLEVAYEGADLEAVAGCDAVTLFVDRAQSVKAGFVLDAANVDAVAQVCRRLDGIALAIELAAARIAMLTPTDLARRLDQRFRLLAGGQRGVVERHQTLRAAIDWSYELLDEAEQLLLARLSVFVGGFSLEAADAVTTGGVVDAEQTFDLLSVLVARSLVVADTENVDTRLRMLETIRQYAQERLDESGDGFRVRAEHAAYFASFGELAIPSTAGPDGTQWERRLERELDNIGAAVRWAVETQDADTAVRLFAMWDAPMISTDVGLTATLRWAADAMVAMPGAVEHPRYLAALGVTAIFAMDRGELELAVRRCEQVLAAERRVGSDPSIFVWLVRTNAALAKGNHDEGVEHAQHAVTLSRARGEPAWLAWSLAVSALARALQGDATNARADAEEVVTLAHRLTNPHILLQPLAFAAFAVGGSDPERGLALAREAVGLIRPGERSLAWGLAGDLAARRGDRHAALEYMANAIKDSQWLGSRMGLGNVVGRVGDLLADNDPEATAVLQGACDALAPGFGHAPHTVELRRQAIATSTASLGAVRREELYKLGMTMTDDQVADHALCAIGRQLDADDRRGT
jgi:predicted ATPase